MKCAIFYVMCLCFLDLKCIVCVEVVNSELDDYLNKKSEAVQETFMEKLKKEVGYFEIEEDTKSEQISGSYKSVFSFFNTTFILLDNQIYNLQLDNGTIRLKKFKKLEDRGNIEFTKVTQFEDLGFILTKTEMEIDIYGFQHNEMFFVHSIFAPYASDALFFVNQNSLYLIVVNNRGDNLSVSMIYKWLGTYFDESEPVFTTGALKVTSFTHNFFEIIVILQYSSSTNLLSTVYEFNFDRIKKMQYIKSSNPSYLDVLKTNFGTYVLVFEKSKNNLIYGWDGSKLVKMPQFQTEAVINKSVTITSNNSSAIAIPLKDKMQIFHILPKEIKLVGEKKFKSNFSLILDIHKKASTNNMVYIIGLNENNTLYIKAISFKARFNDLEGSGKSKDYLQDCFHHLEHVVYSRNRKLKKMHKMLSLFKIDLDQSKVSLRSSATTQVDSNLQTDFDKLVVKLEHLQELLKDYEYKCNNTIINKKVILKGFVEAGTLIGKDVSFKTINDQKWAPEHWLRYKKSQNITGPITLRKIIAKKLNTATDPLFTDLLTKNGHVDIQGNFQVVNLTANKILTKKINDVELDDLYQKNNPQPIQGVKTFENLHTSKAKIDKLNGKPIDEFFSQFKSLSSPKFDNILEVENLVVDTINGIHWNAFRDSVFRIGVTKEINGDLTLPEFKANNITLKTLKNIKVEDLLTTSTDQVIDADIEFAKIFAKNITANTTNGIKLSESALQLENNTVIEVPVKFNELHVKNIELIGELDEEFFLWNGNHIKGTNESDLWQIYEKVVKIKGNLYVNNLILQPNAKLFLEEEEFNPDLTSTYWMKNTTQSITTHFETQYLNVSNLFLRQLNGVEFNQYMLNKDADRPETSYHFENISLLGNVILNPNASHSPNLTKLNEEAVKTTGSYYIKGKKIYTDMLNVKHLETTILDGTDVDGVLNREPVVNVTGKKFFKNIIIKGNLSCDIESVEFLNGANISHLLDTAIYINKPRNIEKLHFKNITVENLWVAKLNNHQVNRHIQNIEKVLATDKINKLTVNGNVMLSNVTGLSKINDIKFEDLLNNTWKHGNNGGILVNLEFSGHVKVNNLITALINDLRLRELTRRLLYRSVNQSITALYGFENIKADNLVVSKINSISLENLIDVSTIAPQTIYAPNGIEFNSIVLQKSLSVNETAPCNLVESLKKFKNPPTYHWDNLEIKDNATFLDPDNILYRLFENAVTSNTRNIIKAPVHFSRHILAKKVIAAGLINDINLQEIIDDAVLTESKEEQIVTGRKVFPTMTISEAIVMKNTDAPTVNKIDIPVVNRLIVRKNEDNKYEVKGTKTFFGGLQCENLHSETVSDIAVENIVTTERLKKIPRAALDVAEVENSLTISSINSFDFDGFLKTRLLTNGVEEQIVDGVYFFDNVQVEDMRVSSINHITVDNVVFDIGQQNITASKHFTRAVDIFGNLTCPYINGINISDLYEKSAGGKNVINGSLTILRPSIVKGNIIAEYINGYPVNQIKQILNQGTIKSEIEKIRHIQVDIVDKIKRNIDHIKFLASDYMYIEKSQDLQISVPNTVSAKTMESNGYVLIHVNGEEPGENCGLPQGCKCPVQYSIEVSPEHSVAIFPSKGTQRIFTYYDDSMIINFLTSSFSTDSQCRSEKTKVINEISIMTWNTASKGNTTGSFHQYSQYITGYISGAEFFTLHGHTYAVIGRYYNPTTDSHDLDCYLIKFSHDKRTAEKIQEIPTGGAWSVYLFHTAQGVTLIIGNIKLTNNTHQSDERTEIYRFNEGKQRFDLLKIVPSYACSMATGVVLGTDSLIVLAHRYAPLQVLKYSPNFDNYYSYQSFELEAPVVGISVFYTGGFGISDAYLCAVTANENYFIYSFRFIEGWKLESSGELEGLRNFIPFELNKQLYLFAPSSKDSSLLTVVKHGSV